MKKLLPVFLIAAIVLAMTSGPVFGALVAYYQFEDNVTDSSGYKTNHNGTLSGTGTYVPGKFGQALSFNGSDTYVTLPLSDVTTPTGTVAGWIKWNSFGSWSRFFDFGKYTNPDTKQYDAFFVSNQLNTGDVSGTTHFTTPNRTSTITLSTNTWYYVALVTGLSSGATLYVYNDAGTLLGTRTQLTPGTQSFDDLPAGSTYYLGESHWEVDAFFNGVMDEVRIYNTALSESEIRNLSAIPIPGALWLLGTGLLSLGAMGYRRRKKG